MLRSWQHRVIGTVVLLSAGAFLYAAAAEKPDAAALRAKAMKAHTDGNFKDAYEGLRKLALDPTCDPAKVSTDLTTGINYVVWQTGLTGTSFMVPGLTSGHKYQASIFAVNSFGNSPYSNVVEFTLA